MLPRRNSNNDDNDGVGIAGKIKDDDSCHYVEPDQASNLRLAGGLTEEKVKQPRLTTVGTESFHDTCSDIASRHASDFKARSAL